MFILQDELTGYIQRKGCLSPYKFLWFSTVIIFNENLIDLTTAEVVYIDLGVSFEK